MVVAQLAERLPTTPEVRGSNPDSGKLFSKLLFTVNCVEKTKIKKKEAGNGPFKKSFQYLGYFCRKIYHIDLSTIAQSGHIGFRQCRASKSQFLASNGVHAINRLQQRITMKCFNNASDVVKLDM